MTEIINLRQQRKAKARTEKAKAAEQNRRLHGLTKAGKKKTELERQQSRKRLDAHKRDKEAD